MPTIQIVGEYFMISFGTDELTGESTFQGSDLPPAYDVPAGAMRVPPFDQDLELELEIDMVAGTVSGHAEILYYDASPAYLAVTAEVSGNATCLPLNGRACGQLDVELELRGIVSDPADPSVVGRLLTKLPGSLIWNATDLEGWAAISANATIGGNEGLINSLLETMEEGETAGV